MYIKEPSQTPALVQSVTHQYIGRNGETKMVTEKLLTEHTLNAVINESRTLSFVCLPQYLPELILGHLVTEGIIHSIHEVEQISFNSSGDTVHVTLNREISDVRGKFSPVTPIPWKAEWVFALADRFAEGMPLHSETWATHSCFLANKNQLLFECEDIGRHNALDKVIGYALRNKLNLQECLVYSSGRIPTDMMRKALHSGIPLLSSKGAPTRKAVELARQYQLTLICAARRDRMKQFSGPVSDALL